VPADSSLRALADARAAAARTVHIGVLVPWANSVVEEEFPAFASGAAVYHYARLMPADHTTALSEGFLSGLRDAAADALTQLQRLRLDTTVMACTSAGFTAPTRQAVSTSFDALCSVLDRAGATRLALATPYPHPVTDQEADALSAAGFEVTGRASLGLDDGYAHVTPAQVHTVIEQIDPGALAAADALVLSCTGWPTRALIAGLESALGIAVYSSNLATVIHTLTIGGAR
jgi:maleate isomerase